MLSRKWHLWLFAAKCLLLTRERKLLLTFWKERPSFNKNILCYDFDWHIWDASSSSSSSAAPGKQFWKVEVCGSCNSPNYVSCSKYAVNPKLLFSTTDMECISIRIQSKYYLIKDLYYLIECEIKWTCERSIRGPTITVVKETVCFRVQAFYQGDVSW